MRLPLAPRASGERRASGKRKRDAARGRPGDLLFISNYGEGDSLSGVKAWCDDWARWSHTFDRPFGSAWPHLVEVSWNQADYFTSDLTGKHYLSNSKRPI